ncbi:MAG: putative porin [Paludibacteraceae bacterium]|nr:putative porin [Paludibacteraceae bacterium]
MRNIYYSLLGVFFFLNVGYVLAETDEKNAGTNMTRWNIDKAFGDTEIVAPDTTALNYHAYTLPMYKNTIASSWLGNLGLPAQSKIYFNRVNRYEHNAFIFRDNYSDYFLSPDNLIFYNTKTPFSNMTYHTGGPTYRKEDYISGLFSVNATPKLNISLVAKHIFGRGAYQSQGTNGIDGALYGSYIGQKYDIHFIAALNNLKHYENGGVLDVNQLNTNIESYNLPVNMSNAWSILNSYYLYATQKFSLGFNNKEDVFVPVTSFGHTVSYEQNQKKYYENSITDFYQYDHYSSDATKDTVAYNVLKNTVYISLNEGFHKWAVMGLRAFIEHEHEQQVGLSSNWTLFREVGNHLHAGAEISRTQGAFTYNALGKVMLLGDSRGGYELDGNVGTELSIGSQAVNIHGTGALTSSSPNYFMEHYYSNHFIWHQDFENTLRSHILGTIDIPNKVLDISLKAGLENIYNHVYFDTEALPQQYSNDIQILHGEASLKLHIGNFHIENTAIYQSSSKQDIIALPTLSSYHNVYYTNTIFKVLNVQLGVDCRYNTAYFANAYMPATGQFYNQTTTRIGNYPLLSAYANVHLKRTRFFVMYYNLSDMILSDKNYILVPDYPLNPSMLKFGLSWNFYD